MADVRVVYDPSIIQAFAEGLYARARSIAWTAALAGAALGLGAGAVVGSVTNLGVVVAGVACVSGGVFGYYIGRDRAFALRLQAQTALCQLQIEANTRNI